MNRAFLSLALGVFAIAYAAYFFLTQPGSEVHAAFVGIAGLVSLGTGLVRLRMARRDR